MMVFFLLLVIPEDPSSLSPAARPPAAVEEAEAAPDVFAASVAFDVFVGEMTEVTTTCVVRPCASVVAPDFVMTLVLAAASVVFAEPSLVMPDVAKSEAEDSGVPVVGEGEPEVVGVSEVGERVLVGVIVVSSEVVVGSEVSEVADGDADGDAVSEGEAEGEAEGDAEAVAAPSLSKEVTTSERSETESICLLKTSSTFEVAETKERVATRASREVEKCIFGMEEGEKGVEKMFGSSS